MQIRCNNAIALVIFIFRSYIYDVEAFVYIQLICCFPSSNMLCQLLYTFALKAQVFQNVFPLYF